MVQEVSSEKLDDLPTTRSHMSFNRRPGIDHLTESRMKICSMSTPSHSSDSLFLPVSIVGSKNHLSDGENDVEYLYREDEDFSSPSELSEGPSPFAGCISLDPVQDPYSNTQSSQISRVNITARADDIRSAEQLNHPLRQLSTLPLSRDVDDHPGPSTEHIPSQSTPQVRKSGSRHVLYRPRFALSPGVVAASKADEKSRKIR